MKIISPLKAALCALALVSPRRPDSVVGSIVVKYNSYNDGVKEYCFEEEMRIGKTWVEDEYLNQKEVPLERCFGEAG